MQIVEFVASGSQKWSFSKREKGQKIQIISDDVHTIYVGIIIFLSLNLSVYHTCNQQLLCQHLSLDQEPPTTSTSDVTARTTTWRLLIMQWDGILCCTTNAMRWWLMKLLKVMMMDGSSSSYISASQPSGVDGYGRAGFGFGHAGGMNL